MKNLIQCPECLKSNPFAKFKIIKLAEGALMVCPVCQSEFDVHSTLTKRGGEEGEEMEFQPTRDEPADFETPAEEPMPGGPGGLGDEEGGGFESVAKVVRCSVCNETWADIEPETCPFCETGGKIKVTKMTLRDRVAQAFREVKRGVPAKRAIGRLLGKPVTVETS